MKRPYRFLLLAILAAALAAPAPCLAEGDEEQPPKNETTIEPATTDGDAQAGDSPDPVAEKKAEEGLAGTFQPLQPVQGEVDAPGDAGQGVVGTVDKIGMFSFMVGDPVYDAAKEKIKDAKNDKEAEEAAAAALPALGAKIADHFEAQGAPPEADQPRVTQTVNEVVRELNRLAGKPLPENGVANPDTVQQRNERNARYYGSAARLSEKVVSWDPENRDALNNLHGAQLGLGRHQAAVQTATRVLDLYQDDQRAYTTRALAYYQMKNFPQALDDAKRALALDPNNETAFKIAKLAQSRVTTADDLGLDARAKEAAKQIDREFEAMADQRNQAESISKTAAPSAPARIAAPASADPAQERLRSQASNKIKLGDYQGAEESATRALQRDPRDLQSRYTRAAARNMSGRYDEALEDANAALEIDPGFVPALDARAQSLLQTGEYHRAIADADRSLALDARNAYAYKLRARAKEKLGDLNGMVEDLRKAAALSPQFDAELREAAAQYGISLATIEPAAPAAAPGAAKPSKSARNRRFIVVLGSSVTGGLLIAMGLLHTFTGSRRRRREASMDLPGSGPDTIRAISEGPSLSSGFRVLGKLGNGGMGVVYEAEDIALGRKVAIKKMRDEISADERERARFLQEARIVAALHHPNIVDIHSILEDDGRLYLVFEHVEGQTLDQILERKKSLTLKEAAYVMRGICHALEYAHSKGVIHRDLKPSNVMVTREGMVKVMDFGIARQAKDAAAAAEQTKTVAGTPQYMAPEQEEGIVRPESDVFSLGACLYEIVTGQRPYPHPSTTASKINKRYTRPTRVRSDLPSEVDAIVDAALEPDPDKRIRSARDFRKRLEALALPTDVPAA